MKKIIVLIAAFVSLFALNGCVAGAYNNTTYAFVNVTQPQIGGSSVRANGKEGTDTVKAIKGE